jgi:hypothetical protein
LSGEEASAILAAYHLLSTFGGRHAGMGGKEWLRYAAGGVHFQVGGGVCNWALKSSCEFSGTVYLRDDWMRDPEGPTHHITHEVMHAWDDRSSPLGFATWIGGGIGDRLLEAFGAIPRGIRFWNSPRGILRENSFAYVGTNRGYGDTHSADYFAEAAAYTIADPAKLPSGGMYDWIVDTVAAWGFMK